MMTFISCAKTMTDHSKVEVPTTGTPQFQAEAIQHALGMSRFSAEELERLLRVNSKIAAENYLRFQDFCSEANKALPALLAYTGIVFKRICPQDFTAEDFQYVQDHLRITSFLYGLLRPLDLIKNYRLEGDVRLPEHEGISMFDYWKPILTDEFIKSIKAQGGTLVNLASNEMKDLFDWKRMLHHNLLQELPLIFLHDLIQTFLFLQAQDLSAHYNFLSYLILAFYVLIIVFLLFLYSNRLFNADTVFFYSGFPNNAVFLYICSIIPNIY